MPHILGEGAGISLIVLEQPGSATLCLLDQFPVPLVGCIQEGAAHPQQILEMGMVTVAYACAQPHTKFQAVPGLDPPTMSLPQQSPQSPLGSLVLSTSSMGTPPLTLPPHFKSEPPSVSSHASFCCVPLWFPEKTEL